VLHGQSCSIVVIEIDIFIVGVCAQGYWAVVNRVVFFLLEYRTVQLVRNFLGVIVVYWVLDLGFLFPDLDRLLGFPP
jgi:hypothetical protein